MSMYECLGVRCNCYECGGLNDYGIIQNLAYELHGIIMNIEKW